MTATDPSPALVRDISEAVYRERTNPADLARTVEQYGQGRVRVLAASYDSLTRAYLRTLRQRGWGVVAEAAE